MSRPSAEVGMIRQVLMIKMSALPIELQAQLKSINVEKRAILKLKVALNLFLVLH